MPGVPSIGTADYNNNLHQPPQNNEETQIPVDAEQMPVDLSTQIPVDYSSEVEGPKKSGSMAGSIIFSLALLGLAGFGGYKYGGSGAKEIAKKYEQTKEALDKIEQLADEKLNDGWLKSAGKKLARKIKEIIAPLKKGTEKAADETKEAAEKAKEAADDAAKNAA